MFCLYDKQLNTLQMFNAGENKFSQWINCGTYTQFNIFMSFSSFEKDYILLLTWF